MLGSQSSLWLAGYWGGRAVAGVRGSFSLGSITGATCSTTKRECPPMHAYAISLRTGCSKAVRRIYCQLQRRAGWWCKQCLRQHSDFSRDGLHQCRLLALLVQGCVVRWLVAPIARPGAF